MRSLKGAGRVVCGVLSAFAPCVLSVVCRLLRLSFLCVMPLSSRHPLAPGSFLSSILSSGTMLAWTTFASSVGLGARRVAASSVHPTARRFTTASPLRSAEDQRPASSQIFTPSDVQAGIAALSAAGYDASTVWEQRVVWGDHDQFQHVNNVHFVRWFESARMFFASTLAKEFPEARRQEIERGTGKSFILAGINVRYRRPVVYPDTVSHPLYRTGSEQKG